MSSPNDDFLSQMLEPQKITDKLYGCYAQLKRHHSNDSSRITMESVAGYLLPNKPGHESFRLVVRGEYTPVTSLKWAVEVERIRTYMPV